MNTTALIIVCVYLLGMLGVGFWTNKKLIKTSTDYMLGGRAIPMIIVACSLAANNIGGGSTNGLVNRAFGSWGVSAVWYVMAASVGLIPMIFFAPKLRKLLAFTIPEVVGRRFGAASRSITAVLNVVSLFCLTASQILTSGVILSLLVGIELNTAILLAGGFTIVYTVMGGLWADAITDLFQWIIIFLGLAIAIPFAVGAAGGWSSMVSALPAQKLEPLGTLGVLGVLSLCLNYFITFTSGPEMVSRIFSAKDERASRNALIWAAVFMGLFAFIPTVIGLAGYAIDPNMPGGKVLATVIFGHCPAWVAGIVSAAIIASTMSSADSDMLCASTIITKDLVPYFRKDVSDKSQIVLTRSLNVIIGLGAMCIALFKIDIITLNIFAFMLRAAGPIGAFLLGLLWKRAGRVAGLAAILVGSAVGIWWQILAIGMKVDNPYGFLPIVVGSAASVAAFALATLIGRALGEKPAPELKA
jgi:SSS family solute:Na+ symporter